MIISSRLERRLSIVATALLTAAIFVMPVKTRATDGARFHRTAYVEIADATPVKPDGRK
ncbi:MAG: hypothetical protein ACRECY_17265 [Phyllobacterium sp.]